MSEPRVLVVAVRFAGTASSADPVNADGVPVDCDLSIGVAFEILVPDGPGGYVATGNTVRFCMSPDDARKLASGLLRTLNTTGDPLTRAAFELADRLHQAARKRAEKN